MSQKTGILISAVAAACTVLSTAVLADDALRADLRPSRAVQLSDAELDGIYAGQGSFMEHVVINNGNALVEKITNQHIVCVNCHPFNNAGKTIVVTFVENPAQIIRRCIHCPF